MSDKTTKFFCFDGDSFTTHSTADAAKEQAEAAIEEYQDDAAEGWPEEVDRVCWGEIRQFATITATRERCQIEDCDGECGEDVHHSHDYDTEIDYGLRGVE